MIDTLSEIYGNLMRNKLRAVATGIAVTSGLFLLIVLLGAGNGVIHTYEEGVLNFGSSIVGIDGETTSVPFDGMPDSRSIQLDVRDLRMTNEKFGNVLKNTSPIYIVSSELVSSSKNHMSGTTLCGVLPGFDELQNLKVFKGRFLNNFDINELRKVVVINDQHVAILFNNENPIGKNLIVDGISYNVVGIYKSTSRWDMNLYIPYTTICKLYCGGPLINRLVAEVDNITTEEDVDKLQSEYIAASGRIHSFAPYDDSAIYIETWRLREVIKKNQNIQVLHVAIWILGLLTLLSGIVGVCNIMLISVKERSREFGVRRAIGARPWSIIRMVMYESLLITSIFGYVGIVLGVFFCECMDKYIGGMVVNTGVFTMRLFSDPTVDITTCVQAAFVLVVAGSLAGFIPAWKAVRIKPVDALRA